MFRRAAAAVLFLLPGLASAQTDWTFRHRFELRGNFRDSHEQRFALRFPFPPDFLPVGQKTGFEETVNAGRHVELSVAQVRLDAAYRSLFAAHIQFHVQDKYRRNPTSEDRKTDADELWVRVGPKPEFLERPAATSVFLQMGKFPHMERQPIRLLESYGVAATAFNRFEDVGFMAGGSIGRNVYWRLTATSGNPLFFRDTNALAGDNGIRELLQKNPDPKLKSGFPILYNTETEGYFLKTKNVQFGQGVGYRWQNDAQTFGFDAIAFHYRRSMPFEEHLTGTFYGADIDLLDGPDGVGIGLPVHGNRKQETGARIYSEWQHLTAIAQFTKQQAAGLYRQGEELELGYQFPRIQPVVRWSALQNFFKGPRTFPAPSVWWNWIKLDYGARITLTPQVDLTVERAKHNIASPVKLNLAETLVTVRVRL
jgi:hypothetical protein